jgi:membrane-associated HD superfamily phosphohydrolase
MNTTTTSTAREKSQRRETVMSTATDHNYRLLVSMMNQLRFNSKSLNWNKVADDLDWDSSMGMDRLTFAYRMRWKNFWDVMEMKGIYNASEDAKPCILVVQKSEQATSDAKLMGALEESGGGLNMEEENKENEKEGVLLGEELADMIVEKIIEKMVEKTVEIVAERVAEKVVERILEKTLEKNFEMDEKEDDEEYHDADDDE